MALKSSRHFNAKLYYTRGIPAYEDFGYKLRSVVDTPQYTGTANLGLPIRVHSMHVYGTIESGSLSPLSVYAKNELEYRKQASGDIARVKSVLESVLE